MNRILIIILLSAFSFTAKSQYKGFKPVENLEIFKGTFNSYARQVHSIQADFKQEKNLSLLTEKIVSGGEFYYKKSNKVRMEYKKPYKSVMVINKNDMTITDSETNQSVSVKSGKLFQQISRIMVDCVEGTLFKNPDFTIRLFEKEDGYLIKMSPLAKGMKDYFKTINVYVNRKDYSVDQIDMIDQTGDNTLITFSNKQMNKELSDALFNVH